MWWAPPFSVLVLLGILWHYNSPDLVISLFSYVPNTYAKDLRVEVASGVEHKDRFWLKSIQRATAKWVPLQLQLFLCAAGHSEVAKNLAACEMKREEKPFVVTVFIRLQTAHSADFICLRCGETWDGWGNFRLNVIFKALWRCKDWRLDKGLLADFIFNPWTVL